MAVREDALACVEAAIAAVEPEGLVTGALMAREGRAGAAEGPVWIAAIGKASAAMARAACRVLGSRVRDGVVVAPPGLEVEAGPLRLLRGGHPIPDEGSVQAGREVHRLASAVPADGELLCLISGGGSALMTLPVEGLSLADVQAVTDALLAAGAGIGELNTVRKHLDRLKGGRLAAATAGKTEALILSDVVGDRLEVIASGPVSPDPTTFADAVTALKRRRVWDRIPAPVRDHLERGVAGDREETPGPGDSSFRRVRVRIVGNNRLAAEAAMSEAKRRGYRPHLLSTELVGEARAAGTRLGGEARRVVREGRPVAPPACLVAAGETTVTVRGSGRGGRNQELALALALALDGVDGVIGLSVGTDGVDGPTDAAGAVATGETVARARRLGLDAARSLDENDSYPFFQALGDLVVTGPTGTNVMDLQLILVAPHSR